MSRLVAYWRQYDAYYRGLDKRRRMVHFVAQFALMFGLSCLLFGVLLGHVSV